VLLPFTLESIGAFASRLGWCPVATSVGRHYKAIEPIKDVGPRSNVELRTLKEFTAAGVVPGATAIAFELRNVVVHPMGCIYVPQANAFVEETLQDIPTPSLRSLLDRVSLDICSAFDLRILGDQVVCYMGHPWAHNYGHWLLEILPRLQLYSEFRPYLLIPAKALTDLGSIVRHSIEMIAPGLGDRVLPFDKPVFVDRLLCVPAINRELRPSYIASLAAETGTAMRMACPTGSSRLPRKLYVSRADAPRRRVSNEAKVKSILRARGYETVYPTAMLLEEQIALFRNADQIVTPFGAAIANSIFCSPGAYVTILYSDGLNSNYYRHLLSLLEVKYSELSCQRLRLDLHAFESDFAVDEACLNDITR
jgi:Glycosyltransferase 61